MQIDQRKIFVGIGILLIVISILQMITSTKIAKTLAILILIIGLVILLGRKGLNQIWVGIRKSSKGIGNIRTKIKPVQKSDKTEWKNCKKCGTQLKINTKFCNECGAKQ